MIINPVIAIDRRYVISIIGKAGFCILKECHNGMFHFHQIRANDSLCGKKFEGDGCSHIKPKYCAVIKKREFQFKIQTFLIPKLQITN